MPATLTIQMDDQTAKGFTNLIGRLGESSKGADALRDHLDAMAESGEVAELRAELERLRSQLDAVSESGQQTKTVMQSFAEQTEYARQATENSISVIDRVVEARSRVNTTLRVAQGGYRTYMLASQAAAAADATAASVIGGVLTSSLAKLTSVAAGVTIGWKGFMSVMDQTGAVAKRSGDMFVYLDETSEDTIVAFQQLEAEAKDAGKSIERYLRETGHTFQEFGLQVETNGDRIRSAWSDLGTELAAPLRNITSQIRDWWNETHILADISEAWDKKATMLANNQVKNIKLVTDAYKEYRIWMEVRNEADPNKARERIKLDEEQAKVTEKLAELNKNNRIDFDARGIQREAKEVDRTRKGVPADSRK